MSNNEPKKTSKIKIVLIAIALLIAANFINKIVDNAKESPINSKNELVSIVDSIQAERKMQKNNFIESFDSLTKSHNFKKSKDEFKPKISYYNPSTAAKYINENAFYPYFVKENKTILLRLKMQYMANDWLFIQKVILKTVNEAGREDVNVIHTGGFERDNKGGKIWEWQDIDVNNTLYLDLLNLKDAKMAKVRYEGKQYQKDVELTIAQIGAFKNAIEVYSKVR